MRAPVALDRQGLGHLLRPGLAGVGQHLLPPPAERRLEQQHGLADLDQSQLLVAIGEHARVHREEQDRQGARRHDETDEERVVGQIEGEPALRHALHPRPDERQRLTDPEQAEVPVARENAEGIERGHAKKDRC